MKIINKLMILGLMYAPHGIAALVEPLLPKTNNKKQDTEIQLKQTSDSDEKKRSEEDEKTPYKKAQYNEKFEQAYKQEFKRIWKDRARGYAVYKKENPDTTLSQEEYVVQEMKKAYINNLKEFYPDNKWTTPRYMPMQERRAEDEARSYIDNDAYAGCCF